LTPLVIPLPVLFPFCSCVPICCFYFFLVCARVSRFSLSVSGPYLTAHTAYCFPQSSLWPLCISFLICCSTMALPFGCFFIGLVPMVSRRFFPFFERFVLGSQVLDFLPHFFVSYLITSFLPSFVYTAFLGFVRFTCIPVKRDSLLSPLNTFPFYAPVGFSFFYYPGSYPL